VRVIRHSRELRNALHLLKKRNRGIGFVPTMGSLHEGHLSLVRQSKRENQATVVSLFVNPLQFGPHEDFWRYPRDPARDTAVLRGEKVDFIFLPRLREFYPGDFQTSVSIKNLSRPLCGVSRPTHFAGVATVVLKLLNIVMPDVIYLGQKDYQQFRLVEQMVKDLDFPVRVRMSPIIREPDGLAMSSRNVLLSLSERHEATFLYRALQKGAELTKAGVEDAAKIKKAVREVLKNAPHLTLDYVEIVDAETLAPVVESKNHRKILIALAVFFGKTRLIDNCLITGS